ncbi:MAG TPA: hypothetical protein VG106_04190, partial [Vicinamibacterales bacterium]|nr:hypothetical protein [Vicinamibacterales bacterium]
GRRRGGRCRRCCAGRRATRASFPRVFELKFHAPATGTFALTRDKSWVLMTKLHQTYDGKLPHPEGIHSKRWLAISRMLPPNYSVASVGPFMHVDAVPKKDRELGRRLAGHLLTADEATLDRVLRSRPLPPEFQLHVSSIPISYYVGLAESDRLGTRVFFESILNEPGPYFRSVFGAARRSIWYSSSEQTYPTVDQLTPATERLIPLGGGKARLERLPGSQMHYVSSDPIFWMPGFRFFSFTRNFPFPRARVVTFMAIGVLIAMYLGFRYGWTFQTSAMVTLFALLAAFVVFSHAILDFRWKEWRCALPVVAILVGTTAGWALPTLLRGTSRYARLISSRLRAA